MKNATRIFSSTFGAIMALAGIEHGIGEVLQGSVVPDGIMIQSWPYSEFFRNLSGEPAMTIIPNLFVTGILAILVSLILLIWSIFFVQSKNGGLVMILISIVMLLVGGGIFPPILTMIIGAIATRINAPKTWWFTHLSENTRRILAKQWRRIICLCILSWFALIPGIGILEQSFGVYNETLILIILSSALGSLFLTAVTGFARDTFQ